MAVEVGDRFTDEEERGESSAASRLTVSRTRGVRQQGGKPSS
jgi:hypothetical protein